MELAIGMITIIVMLVSAIWIIASNTVSEQDAGGEGIVPTEIVEYAIVGINFRIKITDINNNEHLESLTYDYYEGWTESPRFYLKQEIRALRAFVGGVELHSKAIYNSATVLKVEIL